MIQVRDGHLDSLNNHISLQNVCLDSTLTNQAKQSKIKLEKELNTGIPSDTAAVKNEVMQLPTETISNRRVAEISSLPKDSATVANEVQGMTKEQLEKQTGLDVRDVNLDSTSIDQLGMKVEKQTENYLNDTEEFKALEGFDHELAALEKDIDQINTAQEELKQYATSKELKQKMTSQARQYISENADKIQEVHSRIGALKQKYSYLPNSNDLSTAKKRNSLKGELFWERLVLGGNFGIHKTNPLRIDLSPVVGWRFNKLFEVGMTGAYRVKLPNKTSTNIFENEPVYGFSVFANHMIFKNFFGYLEGERMSNVLGRAEVHNRHWHQTLLVGFGRKFKLAKFLEMQSIVTYNFLHDSGNELYNNPVVFKTGFRLR